MSGADEWLEVKRELVTMANAVQPTLTGDFAQVQAMVDDNDVVWAVWSNAAEPDGVGTLLIKGQQRLLDVLVSGKTEAMSVTAIPCTCAEQATALLQVAGEPDGRH